MLAQRGRVLARAVACGVGLLVASSAAAAQSVDADADLLARSAAAIPAAGIDFETLRTTLLSGSDIEDRKVAATQAGLIAQSVDAPRMAALLIDAIASLDSGPAPASTDDTTAIEELRLVLVRELVAMPADAEPTMITALGDASNGARPELARVLGQRGGPAVIGPLTAALGGDRELRYHAIFALGRQGTAAGSALPQLAALASDPLLAEAVVRNYAEISGGTVPAEVRDAAAPHLGATATPAAPSTTTPAPASGLTPTSGQAAPGSAPVIPGGGGRAVQASGGGALWTVLIGILIAVNLALAGVIVRTMRR